MLGSYGWRSFINTNLYASPLLMSAGFREAVLDALVIKSESGTVRRTRQTVVRYELKEGINGGVSASEADLEGVAQGVDQSIRACDYIAWKISAITGAPRCELYWTREKRDEAVKACVAFLKTYGDRFTAEAPRASAHPFEKTAHLAFPILDRPATKEDVRAGRAIFSFEGEGETRRVELPPLPIKAKWITPKEARRQRRGRLGVAGRGGTQRRPVGALLRLRRQARHRTGPRQLDRLGWQPAARPGSPLTANMDDTVVATRAPRGDVKLIDGP